MIQSKFNMYTICIFFKKSSTSELLLEIFGYNTTGEVNNIVLLTSE